MVVVPREERKRRVAEATWRVISEQGITKVSVRTVAAEAGMVVGSLRHLFPTQDELLLFSAELMIQQATERIARLTAEPHTDVVAHSEAVISELIPLTRHTRSEFEVNLALIVQAADASSLAGVRDRAHRDLVDLFQRIVATITDKPLDSPAVIYNARRLLALADGLGLHLLHQPPEADTTWARTIIREELDRIHQGGANQLSQHA